MKPRNTWILVGLAVVWFGFIFFFDRQPRKIAAPALVALSGLKADAVSSVQIQWAGQFPMRVARTNSAWLLTNPILYPAQAVTVDRLLKALEKLPSRTHISARDLKDHARPDEEFGFASPMVTITLKDAAETRQIQFGKLTAPGDEVYMQVVGGEGIDTVDNALFNVVPRTPDNLRDTAVVNLLGAAFNRITAATGPKVESSRMELTRDQTNGPWRMMFPLQARVDNARIEELVYNLETMQASSFVTDDPGTDLDQFGLQPPQLQLTISQGTNDLAVLQFGRGATNDATQIYARRAGQKTIMLAPRAAVEPWRGEYTDFRDRRLAGPHATDFDVIEVRAQNGEKFTVQRQTNATWRLMDSPEFSLDPRRMNEFIDRLTRLEVVRVNGQFAVKENVDPTALGTNYGLAMPERQYFLKKSTLIAGAVGTNNSVLVELDFGRIIPEDREKMYARRPDESAVYAVQVADFRRLPSAAFQLRDRAIWRFTADDVKLLTLRQGGSAVSIIVHRGPLDYVIQQGSQGLIDSAAMESGIADLGELTAENWVARGATNRADFGLSEKSLQIAVDLVVKGQRQTLTLDLGGWSPNRLRYAAVSLDGQEWVCELPRRLYESLVVSFALKEPAGP